MFFAISGFFSFIALRASTMTAKYLILLVLIPIWLALILSITTGLVFAITITINYVTELLEILNATSTLDATTTKHSEMFICFKIFLYKSGIYDALRVGATLTLSNLGLIIGVKLSQWQLQFINGAFSMMRTV
jgi:hypothetical protein